MGLRVERFAAERLDDFLAVHSESNGAGWCRCVAWWVSSWNGWGERTVEENARLRLSLGERGEWDGLLAYVGDRPVGWCQVGPRDRLVKLAAQHGLEPDPGAWAVSCFLVAPEERGRGVARALLDGAIDAARTARATTLEGFPRVTASPEPGDAWTGPAALFAAAGFEPVSERAGRVVVRLELTAASHD